MYAPIMRGILFTTEKVVAHGKGYKRGTIGPPMHAQANTGQML